MTQRCIAIINPVSGRGARSTIVPRVARALRQEGASLETWITNAAGHGTQLAARVPDDVEAVLVVGGDGTVCEVVNGLFGRKIPIVILGTGTENLLARELRMPTDPAEVARALLHGRSFPFDVGVVTTGSQRRERRFLAMVGVGFDAECVYRLARVRRGHITHFDYFWPIWRTFWSHGFPPVRVEADGACVFEGRGPLLVGVIGQYSGGLRVLANARYDDGLLDLCVLPCSSGWGLLTHAARMYARCHTRRGDAVYLQARHIRVESRLPVPVEVDGDAGGLLPIDISIAPGAIKFRRAPVPSIA